jgi:hypothetical protein
MLIQTQRHVEVSIHRRSKLTSAEALHDLGFIAESISSKPRLARNHYIIELPSIARRAFCLHIVLSQHWFFPLRFVAPVRGTTFAAAIFQPPKETSRKTSFIRKPHLPGVDTIHLLIEGIYKPAWSDCA